jgi:hypothetical protein
MGELPEVNNNLTCNNHHTNTRSTSLLTTIGLVFGGSSQRIPETINSQNRLLLILLFNMDLVILMVPQQPEVKVSRGYLI